MNEPRIPTEGREPAEGPPSLPALDSGTAERLLDGRLGGIVLPPPYAAVRHLLDAASGPALPSELAAETVAVATFRERPPTQTRRPRVLAKVLTVKAAVVAASALSVAGVAAAATGSLPGLGDRPTGAAAASAAPSATPVADPGRAARIALCEAAHRGGAAEAKPAAAALARLAGGADAVEDYCADAGTPTDPSAGHGPDATGAARQGLCRAAAAGQGAEYGDKASAVAFEALARAAGGAEKVEAYCRAAASLPAAADAPSPATSAPRAPAEHTRGGEDRRPTDLPSVVPSPSHPTGRP